MNNDTKAWDLGSSERPYRYDPEYRAEVKAAGTDAFRLAQIEEHWAKQAELRAEVERLKANLRAKVESEAMVKIYDTRAMSNPPPADTRGYKVGAEVTYKEVRPGVAHGENCHTCPACLKAVADNTDELKRQTERLTYTERARTELANALATRNTELAEAERKLRSVVDDAKYRSQEKEAAIERMTARFTETDAALTRMKAARDEALAALEKFAARDTRLDLTPVDPDGPPSRRGLQLAIAIMVWILGLALLAAHFAAGGAF